MTVASPHHTADRLSQARARHTTLARGGTKKEIRIELSRPSKIGDDGKISAWSERILIDNIPFDGDPIVIEPPSGPDIDIEIRRKA